ncbi:hypothetical protein A5675_18115 [Mycobacterium malmoense]|uniref:Uncharacterized protein n=1 Tax=Mycobacterium malmoense TaxID=1780 RepID=A0A1B9CUD1_MYCMA|nr:hypothetical protein A5674_00030 [Mycobacterium malmoense]OCB35953.1 hypothetical protein A5675_18115 [Mycobacterium malmoense]OCB36772.1 hypothetical protein A5676_19780 [Mycobacterium malmoense]OCB46270.1 hypothetical protein A5677_04275 [Mycobacterium malmoense]
MHLELNVDVVGYRPGLTAEDQAIGAVFGSQHISTGHIHLARNQGRHAGAAMSFTTRVRHIDPGIEHRVDQGLIASPLQSMESTVQLNVYGRHLDVGAQRSALFFDICHAADPCHIGA